MKLYVLFEHAAGYAVFKVAQFEEIGMLLPQLEQAVSDVGRFKTVVQLESFLPFKTAISALGNINAISEGVLPDDLKHFLDVTVPKKKKKGAITLGVSDAKLGAAISEALDIQCNHVGAVPEILRGIRHHFHNLVKGFTQQSQGVAQLGLGHAYSRAKVKFNVHRVDNMIIQSIALLDQLDKDVNTFSMRIREWYSYHFPELYKIVPDNYTYARLAKCIKNRVDLLSSPTALHDLEELTLDGDKAQAILDAAKSSMGMEINPVDLINIELFAQRVIDLADYRRDLATYLHTKMTGVAPNLAELIGDQVGARLIAHAGSLTNLAKFPASTVQILGAEKALFRAIKTRSNTPKYGLLFHSTFIGRAGQQNKGRISRYLANKCSIASRIDCFTDQQMDTPIFGEKLKQQVEDRLKYYSTGEVPKKNLDVMQEAITEAQQHQTQKKKKKKKKSEETNGVVLNNEEELVKKKKKRTSIDSGVSSVEETPKPKKKKKKKLET